MWADLDKCGRAQLERMADRGDLAFKLFVLTNLSLVAWVARQYFASKAPPPAIFRCENANILAKMHIFLKYSSKRLPNFAKKDLQL